MPGEMVWSLCALLTRFLERGPNLNAGLTAPSGGRRKGVRVDTLAINVVTTEFFNSINKYGQNQTLLTRLGEALRLLLFRSDVRDLAEIAFQRIGKVSLSLDGKLEKSWDLKELYTSETN